MQKFISDLCHYECTIVHFKNSVHELDCDYYALLNTILRNLNYIDLYPNTCFKNHEHHKFYIIRLIVEEFIGMQANYLAKDATLNEQETLMRSKLKKIIHNCGQ